MLGIEKLNFSIGYSNYYNTKSSNRVDNNITPGNGRSADVKPEKLENTIYKKPERAFKLKPEYVDPIKRPLQIGKSNNIFYINYNGKNETVKVDPGEYTLTELSLTIQKEVDELFGSGKIKVDLTASGSDRLLQARDSKIHNYIDK